MVPNLRREMSNIAIQNLNFSYQQNLIFSGLDLTLEKNSKYLLLGANGSGKSTLLKIIAGIINTDFDAEQEVSYLGHDLQLYLPLTVWENILFFYQVTKQKFSLKDYLKKWELQDLQKKKISELSKGQKQRASLACALINKSSFIILDEPSSNLDEKGIKILFDYLKEMKDLTLLVASHDLKRLGKFFDKFLLIKDSSSITLSENPEKDYMELVR